MTIASWFFVGATTLTIASCLFGVAAEINIADLREAKEKGEASTLAKEFGTSPFQQPKQK